jgi:glycosyltransferase involved in cell wall biosynthesis
MALPSNSITSSASPFATARPFAPYLTVVVPVYNEEDNLINLQRRLRESLNQLNIDYEIIYVDDGSRDRSFEVLAEIATQDRQIKVIKFRKNYGQTAAMAAGFEAARGKVIVPLDADLQNDPQDIAQLLAKIDEGYDVVSGWRRQRQDTLVTRKIPSMLANRLISSVTGVYLHDYGCSLKAYRAEIIKDVKLYGEMHRFIPAFSALEGARVTEVPVNHFPRVAGKSKYGLSRTIKVFLDLLVVKFLGTYAKRPIHIFGGLGLTLCLTGTLSAAATLYQKWMIGVFVHRNPLILLAVFLFTLGVQLIMMGLIAELIIRIYHESQGKKTYTVARTLNLD